MRDTRNPELERLSQQAARDTEAFLAAGGVIERVEGHAIDEAEKIGWQGHSERTARQALGRDFVKRGRK